MKTEKPRQENADSRMDEMSETEIDETLEASFPASDPPAWTLGTDHHAETKEDSENGEDD
jgi:hypothetical protein